MADEEAQTPPEEEGGITVEIEKPGKAPRASDEELETRTDVPEDEVSKYAADAQKRIKGLRVAYTEQKRRAEQWSRDASTAANLAEQLYRENQALKHNVNRSEAALIEQAIARSNSELEQAKTRHKQAQASQDPDLIAAATEDLARSVAESDRLRLLRPGPEQATPPAPAQPQGKPASPRTQAWIAQNPWWHSDKEMREYALNQHAHLALDGITDESNPDLYWRTIEDKMSKKFPDRFSGGARQTEGRARPVAATGTTRTNGSATSAGKQVIKLTDSQVRLAGRLGITLEQYAKQLIDEEKERQGRIQ